MKHWILAGALALVATSGAAMAQQEDVEAESGTTMAQFVDQLHFQQGKVAIKEADATLDVAPGFHYLGAKDARRVLEEAWGNPPDEAVLGLLVPDDAGLDSEHSWAVVVSYSDDGYVSDEDAREIDYDEILAQMKSDIEDSNAERKKQGYSELHLLGWAQPPEYDAASKRLYWAKEAKFGDSDTNTLNYDIRVLGREGYLNLSAVSSMDDLALVKEGMERVLPMANFEAGHRYADHKSGDKVAAYGLAALVAGGVAAKAGLFGKIGLLLLSLKKGLILVFAAIAAGFKKVVGLFKKKEGTVT
jgi:uncharacterized membrane-anchored protein